jgi:hypothetical protein
MKPIEGMTTDPYGLPFMADAWLACVIWAAERPENIKQFKIDTGYDLTDVLKSRGLNKLIDQATGYDRKVVSAWADWVTKNYWGIEGEEDQD